MQYSSTWNKESINIDGKISDWGGNLIQTDHKDILMGVKNDNKYIYFTFTTGNKQLIKQIKGRGIVIWIDPETSNSRNYGIKFLMGRFSKDYQQTSSELSLYDSESEEYINFSQKEVSEISVSYKEDYNKFVYELRLERKQSFEYLPDLVKSESLSIGIESPKKKRKMLKQFKQKRNKQNFSSKGSRRGTKGKRMNNRKGNKKNLADPISVWIDVNLATKY